MKRYTYSETTIAVLNKQRITHLIFNYLRITYIEIFESCHDYERY